MKDSKLQADAVFVW